MARQKWSLRGAAVELGCDRTTLGNWIAASAVIAAGNGKDGSAVYGMAELAPLMYEKKQPESLDRGPKYEEEVRLLRRKNDLAEKQVAYLSDIEAEYSPLFKRVSELIDRVPEIAADACSAIDGRGRERIAAALVEAKNEVVRAQRGLADQVASQ